MKDVLIGIALGLTIFAGGIALGHAAILFGRFYVTLLS